MYFYTLRYAAGLMVLIIRFNICTESASGAWKVSRPPLKSATILSPHVIAISGWRFAKTEKIFVIVLMLF